MTLQTFFNLYGETTQVLSKLIGTEIVIADEKYPTEAMKISRFDRHESVDSNGIREWQTLYVDYKKHTDINIPQEMFDRVELIDSRG